jgi:hypothetical protein
MEEIVDFKEQLKRLNAVFYKPALLSSITLEKQEFNLVLIPYYLDFTKKYYDWMQDEDLRKSVGTDEEMSMEEVLNA